MTIRIRKLQVHAGVSTNPELQVLAASTEQNIEEIYSMIRRLQNESFKVSDVVDEDNMTSDSDSLVPTQQSVKAFVEDTNNGGTTQGTGATSFNIRANDEGDGPAGSARGEHSLDLQTDRTNASEAATGDHAVISGGKDNTVSSTGGTVAGGALGTISGDYSATGGGYDNSVSAAYSVCAGGFSNDITQSYAFCGGGNNNAVSGTEAVVAGGASNTASGAESVVAGGQTNTATAQNASVGGGQQNDATGQFSTVPGGNVNVAAGDYSVAMGRRAKTGSNNGSFRFADSYNGDFTTGQAADNFGCRFSGGYNFYSDTGCTTGVTLAASGGSWGSVSDKNLKENYREINHAETIEKLDKLPVTEWNYISQGEDVRHYGPFAQDFHAAFGLDGDRDKTINTTDADGVLFSAVKGLIAENRELRAEILEIKMSLAEIKE